MFIFFIVQEWLEEQGELPAMGLNVNNPLQNINLMEMVAAVAAANDALGEDDVEMGNIAAGVDNLVIAHHAAGVINQPLIGAVAPLEANAPVEVPAAAQENIQFVGANAPMEVVFGAGNNGGNVPADEAAGEANNPRAGANAPVEAGVVGFVNNLGNQPNVAAPGNNPAIGGDGMGAAADGFQNLAMEEDVEMEEAAGGPTVANVDNKADNQKGKSIYTPQTKLNSHVVFRL